MASAWAQLSKEDQAAWSSSGMDKATYNDKYGKGGETAPPPPTSDPSEERITQSDLKEQLSGQRSLQEMQDLQKSGQVTGDKAQEYLNRRIEKVKGKIYTGDVEDFDGTRGGAGSKKGYDRLSKSDLKGLVEGGMTKEEAYEYATSGDHGHDVSGEKAQKLLGKWKNEFTNSPPPEETQPEPTPEPTPETDPVEPDPGNPGNTNPGNPNPGNPNPGGGGNDDIDVNGDDNNVIGDDGIVNEDIGNTDIDDSLNGGTIGDVTQGGTITGDNNTINNTVDNSNNSRYYGGDVNNMSINYGDSVAGSPSGTWSIPTSPMSDLTMLGYGKPSDSPASSMEFVDRYSTMNRDTQQQYDNFGSRTAAKFIANARANNSMQGTLDQIQDQLYGYTAYDQNGNPQAIPGTAQQFYNNSLDRQVLTFGEMDKYPTFKYNSPMPLDPVETDLEDAQEDAMNRL